MAYPPLEATCRIRIHLEEAGSGFTCRRHGQHEPDVGIDAGAFKRLVSLSQDALY
jgi:hypothetical protein